MMAIVVLILVVLGIVSIHLSLSGYLSGRTYVGWALLIIYIGIYIPFAIKWYIGLGNMSIGMIFHVIFLVLLLLPQGPLMAELITLAVMPDASKGLKLLKIHTEAERKVVEDDLPGAIEEYERIIVEDPEDTAARFRLAELCHQNEEYRRAAKVYEDILQQAKELGVDQHCTTLTRLSELYAYQLGDIQTARRHIRTIIEKFPNTKYAGYARERLNDL